MSKIYQHGEILLMEVSEMPKGKTQKVNKQIVAHSETGHHHVVESDTTFDVWTDEAKEELFLELFEPAKLVHKKSFDAHKTLNIKKGIYKILHKNEYDPFSQIVRRVKD